MMKQMKKVEVIIEAVYINRLLKLFAKNGIKHYTIFTDIEGSGGHGRKMADDVTEISSNDYILTVCEEEQFTGMEAQIGSFLKKYGGKCFVTDTAMMTQ